MDHIFFTPDPREQIVDHIFFTPDPREHRSRLRTFKIAERTVRHQTAERVETPFFEKLPYGGGAYSLSAGSGSGRGFLTRHNNTGDARLGQLFLHDPVIDAGHKACGLFADVADADVQGRRYFGKDLQIQESVALDDRGLILLEIAREGGAAGKVALLMT